MERIRVAPRTVPTRRESTRPIAAPTPRTPLKHKRRAAKKRLLFIFGIVLVILLVAAEVVLWQSFLRVQTIEANGPNAEALKAFAANDLTGTRYFILPKNSIFFLPEKQLRADILQHFADIEAISIAPKGLTTLTLIPTGRAAVFWWCGDAPDAPQTTCYHADASGLVFEEVPLEERYASTSMLTIYAPLGSASSTPLGASIAKAASLPGLLQFVKAMRSLGGNIVSVTLRGDEADLYTQAGTRITYVLGREEQAAALAASGISNLNLNDGSLLYVDLRFDSKIFFKKK